MANSQLAKVQGSLIELMQTATGLYLSDDKDAVRDISHFLQRAIQGRLLDGVVEEIRILKERGRIKEDYESTDQCRQGLSYLFAAVSSDGAIDEKRFNAIKTIFLKAAQEDVTDRNKLLPIELMRICSTLNTGEIMVLEAAYRLSLRTRSVADKTPLYQPNNSNSWLDLIAKESGIEVRDMVFNYEQALIEKGMLSRRTPGNQIVADANYHLSGGGIKLCEFILDDIESL